jgi:hypothetical protein
MRAAMSPLTASAADKAAGWFTATSLVGANFLLVVALTAALI